MDVDQVIELADWITNNTGNPFNQIGRLHKSDLRGFYDSDSEYQNAIKRKNEALARARRKEEEQRRRFEKEADDQRQIRKASRFASHRDRNTPVRAELILKFDDLLVRDQLAVIAGDNVHAPNFYPTKCASSATVVDIVTLPYVVKKNLVLKLGSSAKLVGKY